MVLVQITKILPVIQHVENHREQFCLVYKSINRYIYHAYHSVCSSVHQLTNPPTVYHRQMSSPLPTSFVQERIGERGLRTGEGGGAACHDATDAGAVVIFEGMACAAPATGQRAG